MRVRIRGEEPAQAKVGTTSGALAEPIMVSIKEMKQVITNSGLSVAGLLERKDVEERYAEALKASKKKSKRLAKAVERGPEGPTTGQASFFAGKSGRAVNDFLSKPDTAGLPRNSARTPLPFGKSAH